MKGTAENLVATAIPEVTPNSTASSQRPDVSQFSSEYSASIAVPAAATSSVASPACPRIGGTEASNATASSAAACDSNSRRAHNQVARNSSTRNGSVPARASVR